MQRGEGAAQTSAECIVDHVFIVHGIRDNDAWGERIASVLRSNERATYLYPYNYFSLFSFLNPFSRWRAAARMEEKIIDKLGRSLPEGDTISFVAHSFGTHLVFRFVKRFHENYRINSIALLSSVLPSLKAPTLIGKCRRFHNFAATRDWVLVLNNLIPFPGTGLAGRIGCASYIADADNKDVFYPIRHGDWFEAGWKRATQDWFIGGALKEFFEGGTISSEVERPKISGWVASLLNVYKLIVPTIIIVVGAIVFHTLTYERYANNIDDILTSANVKSPPSVLRLADTKFSWLYDLVGGGKAEFDEKKEEILFKFIGSTIVSKFVTLDGFSGSVSASGQSALLTSPQQLPIVVSMHGGLSGYGGDGKLYAAGGGVLACTDNSIRQYLVFPSDDYGRETASGAKPAGLPCEEFRGTTPYNDDWSLAINDHVIAVERYGNVFYSPALTLPEINEAIGEPDRIPEVMDAEGASYAADGYVAPAQWDGSSAKATYLVIERDETKFFIALSDLSFTTALLQPRYLIPGEGDETEASANIDAARFRYRDGGRVLILRCEPGSCTFLGGDLPAGRAVSEISDIAIDKSTCQLEARFLGVDAGAPLLDVPWLCYKSIAENSVRVAKAIDPPSFDRILSIENGDEESALILEENPKRPSSRPRHEFSNLLAVLECPLLMPGYHSSHIEASDESVRFVCTSASDFDGLFPSDATVTQDGIVLSAPHPFALKLQSVMEPPISIGSFGVSRDSEGSFNSGDPERFSVFSREGADDLVARVESIVAATEVSMAYIRDAASQAIEGLPEIPEDIAPPTEPVRPSDTLPEPPAPPVPPPIDPP